ncbi:hypothetical protein BJG93_30970 (plasmid) [Paraburkholderia sprentiae WSM5005]|uniref:Uncharacterized protein n=1 Tax=Paraburkholderia sprentiae WSM5005 TaxID=754502 RepID=A0A1I9YVC7_9BURK|nr:hypothetical protein [Paraburkholderia sprentiae]APA90164.1 hypothetical protein BJG93_30970 [Paraburkholderia sprentiae WSM5005]
MRVQAIQIADFLVSWTVTRDSEGAFQWVVLVTERGGEHRTVFERRGTCGHVSWGDALDIAAENARGVAAALVESGEPDETKPGREQTPAAPRVNH